MLFFYLRKEKPLELVYLQKLISNPKLVITFAILSVVQRCKQIRQQTRRTVSIAVAVRANVSQVSQMKTDKFQQWVIPISIGYYDLRLDSATVQMLNCCPRAGFFLNLIFYFASNPESHFGFYVIIIDTSSPPQLRLV